MRGSRLLQIGHCRSRPLITWWRLRTRSGTSRRRSSFLTSRTPSSTSSCTTGMELRRRRTISSVPPVSSCPRTNRQSSDAVSRWATTWLTWVKLRTTVSVASRFPSYFVQSPKSRQSVGCCFPQLLQCSRAHSFLCFVTEQNNNSGHGFGNSHEHPVTYNKTGILNQAVNAFSRPTLRFRVCVHVDVCEKLAICFVFLCQPSDAEQSVLKSVSKTFLPV